MSPDTPPLEDYLAALTAALGLRIEDLDVPAILDLARDAAHTVARPSAPLTTFLVGLAAGRAGGSPGDVAAAVATAHTTIETL